eukprot:2013270-Amphidinium_carterae.2
MAQVFEPFLVIGIACQPAQSHTTADRALLKRSELFLRAGAKTQTEPPPSDGQLLSMGLQKSDE